MSVNTSWANYLERDHPVLLLFLSPCQFPSPFPHIPPVYLAEVGGQVRLVGLKWEYLDRKWRSFVVMDN